MELTPAFLPAADGSLGLGFGQAVARLSRRLYRTWSGVGGTAAAPELVEVCWLG